MKTQIGPLLKSDRVEIVAIPIYSLLAKIEIVSIGIQVIKYHQVLSYEDQINILFPAILVAQFHMDLASTISYGTHCKKD